MNKHRRSQRTDLQGRSATLGADKFSLPWRVLFPTLTTSAGVPEEGDELAPLHLLTDAPAHLALVSLDSIDPEQAQAHFLPSPLLEER
jgi:hypothetical protein